MNTEEYIYKLESALDSAVKDHMDGLKSIQMRSYTMAIAKVERVFSTAKVDNIPLHTLLSGNIIDVIVEGKISLHEKRDDGTTGREVSFWITPAKIKFDSTTVQFIVVDITGFLALDFN